jgi:hypothetical protein
MGLGHERFNEELMAWASDFRWSEINPRRFYQRWAQLMTADTWAEITNMTDAAASGLVGSPAEALNTPQASP